MYSIKDFLEKSKEECKQIINMFSIEEKNKLIKELIDLFENFQYKNTDHYLNLFILLETEEEYVSGLFKNNKSANYFLSYYLSIFDLPYHNSKNIFSLKYIRYIDISKQNYIQMLKLPHTRLFDFREVSRGLITKKFNEEEKKDIVENFSQWLFQETTKYNYEEKKLFLENIGFLPFLVYHQFEKNNPDNQFIIEIIANYWNNILEMNLNYDHNYILGQPNKYFHLIHVSINDFMFECFFRKEGGIKNMDEFDMDSYIKLCKLNIKLHENMINCDYLSSHQDIKKIIEEQFSFSLNLDNF